MLWFSGVNAFLRGKEVMIQVYQWEHVRQVRVGFISTRLARSGFLLRRCPRLGKALCGADEGSTARYGGGGSAGGTMGACIDDVPGAVSTAVPAVDGPALPELKSYPFKIRLYLYICQLSIIHRLFQLAISSSSAVPSIDIARLRLTLSRFPWTMPPNERRWMPKCLIYVMRRWFVGVRRRRMHCATFYEQSHRRHEGQPDQKHYPPALQKTMCNGSEDWIESLPLSRSGLPTWGKTR